MGREMLILPLALALIALGPGCRAGARDADGDGYSTLDCDDSDPSVHPMAPELECSGVDENCDGHVDPAEIDRDGDRSFPCQGDCDDRDPSAGPDQVEQCDGVDNDCDGELLESEVDADGDGALPCADDLPGDAAFDSAVVTGALRWAHFWPGIPERETNVGVMGLLPTDDVCPSRLTEEAVGPEDGPGGDYEQTTWTGGCVGSGGAPWSGSVTLLTGGWWDDGGCYGTDPCGDAMRSLDANTISNGTWGLDGAVIWSADGWSDEREARIDTRLDAQLTGFVPEGAGRGLWPEHDGWFRVVANSRAGSRWWSGWDDDGDQRWSTRVGSLQWEGGDSAAWDLSSWFSRVTDYNQWDPETLLAITTTTGCQTGPTGGFVRGEVNGTEFWLVASERCNEARLYLDGVIVGMAPWEG